MKLPEENIGEKLPDIGLGNNFLAVPPKAQAAKAKINTWDSVKIKCFLHMIQQSHFLVYM